jgi:hypothetical protein
VTFAFDVYFVWKLAPLADERKGFFHRINIAKIDASEHVFNVANSYLACSYYYYLFFPVKYSGQKKRIAPLPSMDTVKCD